MTEEQKKEIMEMVLQCKVCGSQMPLFFRGCAKTTDYTLKKSKSMYVCNEQCKDKWESKYFIEEYKGNKIYCINGKYIPYFGAAYSFGSLEDCKKRIDNKHLAFAPFFSYQ